MSELVGQTLGHYRVAERIGAGGMGEVYRAHDERLDRDVAIKVLPASVAQDEARLERFEREARAVAKLEHPSILAIHDFRTEEGVTYAVTELLEGQNLRERVPTSGLPWQKALEIGAAIADGLAAAHSKGIVHRDLKPENVFVTSDGRVKILDFGLAAIRGELLTEAETGTLTPEGTLPGTVMGTLGYMSPEQLRGEPADAGSDIFALGCVLYEMVSGRRAFSGTTAAEAMAAILKEEPQRLSSTGASLPVELESTIHRCLEKSPDARFQSASDLAYNLRSLSSAPGVSATRPARRRVRWRRAGPWLAALGAVIVALAWVNPGDWRSRLLQSADSTSSGNVESMAVLPFVNVGGDEDTAYLSDGIPASIIDRLSKLPGLHVVPRSSAFHFREPGQDLAEVGRLLDVNAILTGEVRPQDETLVIRVELVDVLNNRQLWGERFTRTLDDVLETEVEIANHVTQALRIELRGEDRGLRTRGGTSNPVAHRHYLRGQYLQSEVGGEDGLRRALESYREAVREDPDFALAYCDIAAVWLNLDNYNLEPHAKAVAQAKEAVERALTIDPNLAEAHSNSAWVSEVEWDPVTARQEYLRALDLDPRSATARRSYAWHLALQGKVEAALAEMRIVRETDPVSVHTATAEMSFLAYARRYDEALIEIEKARQLRPGKQNLLRAKGEILALQGKYDDALVELGELRKGENIDLLSLAYTFARAGKRDDARSVLSELERRAQAAPISPVYFAYVHANLGEKDLAFGLLEQAFVERDAQLLYLKVDPWWDPIRDDPRFAELISRIPYFAED